MRMRSGPPNPTGSSPPFISWATAATNIQDAFDTWFLGGKIVVSNGVYQSGSRVVLGQSSRVALTKAVSVQSVNGPAATVIDGGGIMRCAYLTNGAVLSGFTLTNGFVATQSGGGATGGLLTNCLVIRNFSGGVAGNVGDHFGALT